MNRRVLVIVVGVAAVLAIAPQLPRWLPAIAAWIQQVDLASVWQAIGQQATRVAQFAVASPWLLPALAGAAALLFIVVITWRIALRRGARSVERSAITPIKIAAATSIVPSPQAAVAAPPPSHVRFARPAVEPAPSRRPPEPPQPRPTSGRGTTVRRLVADGRTVAEIARATGIGQDAVRAMVAGT